MSLEGYLTYEDISAKVGVPVPTLYLWKHRGKMPPPDILWRQPLWKRETIDRWEKEVHDDNR